MISGFSINYHSLQELFNTANINQSHELLEKLGGADALFQHLQSDRRKGIEEIPTIEREQYFGINRLPPPRQTSFMSCVWKQTKDFCIRILTLAAILMFGLAFISPDPFDSIIQAISIVLAVMAVVIIGAHTDYRKEKQFIQLYLEQERDDKKIFVVTREGRELSIEHFELQVGDLVKIKAGDNITVDGIILNGSEVIEVDESMITGLTDTLRKQPLTKGNNYFLRAGSNVFEGNGQLLVLAVGEFTFANRMKDGNDDDEEEEEIIHDEQSPLSKALETIAKFLVFIGCMAALVMFVVLEFYMVREVHELQEKVLSRFGLMKVFDDFIAAFLIIVLSIPEGLPLIVTLSMAFSIAKLKEKDVVVRNLHVCQVLGGIDVFCFDKTGTLTKNNLSVQQMHAAGSSLEVRASDPLFRAYTEAVLATNTSILPAEQAQSQISRESGQELTGPWIGNRMDVALMDHVELVLTRDFILEYKTNITQMTKKYISIGQADYCAAILSTRGDSYRIYIKGNSKEILSKCKEMAILHPLHEVKQLNVWEPGSDNQCQQTHNIQLEQIFQEHEGIAIKGYIDNSFKVITFAYRDVHIPDIATADWNQLLYGNKEFTYIATLALRDDVRDDAHKLDSILRKGHMEVQILTGDTRINAVNVAKQLRWVNEDHANAEIQRQSEHLVKSSQQLEEFLLQQHPHNHLHDVQPQKIKSDIMEIPIETDLLIPQQPVKEPLILNFHEFVKRLRVILEESKIHYLHSDVNDKNITSRLGEILEDSIALQKLVQLNKNIQILADLNPHQKQQYVQVLSKINESTVAYVGDGNNDALALRQAAVGFALGQTATNVAKECSGVILMGDKLSGIEHCIRWGRNIFQNIKRFIYFQLSFFLTSISVMLTASIALHQQPYSVLEVIWLSLVQDIFSAIALSTEIPQSDIIEATKPVRRGQNLIDSFLLKLIGTQAAFQYFATTAVLFLAPRLFGIENSSEHDINEIGQEFKPEWAVHYTLVYHLTASFQIINLINARRVGHHEYNTLEGITKNRPFTVMIVFLIFIQQVIIYMGDKYFKTAALTLFENLFCLVLSFGSLLIFWLSKYIYSK